MPTAGVYADECIDRPVVEALRARGFEVLTAVDAGRQEDPDSALLAHATSLGRIVRSYNRQHFRRLHRVWRDSGREHGGIVLLPRASPVERRQLRAAMLLDWAALAPEQRSRLFQWNDLQQRLQAGFRLPGYTEEETRQALGWA